MTIWVRIVWVSRPGLGIDHFEVDVFLHHLGKVVERDVTAGPRIVQTTVGVLLDDDRFAILRLIGHI
jgi:hypothetical protein